MSDDWRVDVARAIADRVAIDWGAVGVNATASADLALVDELRVLERVAHVHAAPPVDGVAGGASPSLDVLPAKWGSLSVLEHIGRGTFADVYRAHDPRLDRMVALKILRRQQSAHASAIIAEARLLAKVSHPNVVTVFGAERIGGQVGVWMSLIDGPTLEEELRTNGPFGSLAVAGIGLDLCGALNAVHRAGVVHHDVKTENIMRSADGRIVLADFGAGSDASEIRRVTGGELAGTPLYLAPEVLDKHPASPQSDIYSLGVVLFHLLTGSFPLVGRTIDDLRQAHAAGEGRRVREARPDVHTRLARVIDQCLAKDPAKRLQDAAAVAQAFRRASASPRTTRRALAAALVVLTMAAVAVLLWPYGPDHLARSTSTSTAVDALSLRKILDRNSTSASEDGRYIVSSAFIHDLVSGGQKRWLPASDGGTLGQRATISRDGTQIAYEWCTAFQQCELRVRLLGSDSPGASRALLARPDAGARLWPSDWSGDGRRLLVQRSDADGSREIGIVDVQDGSFRVLTTIDWRVSTAFFSPDGRAFAFDVSADDAGSQRDIFVMVVDSGERIPAVVSATNDVLMGWSPDGRHLLFASNRGGTTDLWAVPLSDRWLPGIPERLKVGIGNFRSVGMTNSGSLYLRAPANEVDIELASIDLSSGKLVAAPTRPPQSIAGTNLEPAWSPDGRLLAYLSRRAGDDSAGTIAIYSVTTRALRELSPLKLAWAQGLSWAPDGGSLAFTAVDLNGRCGLFRIDLNTGAVSKLAYPIPLTFQGPHWSPDGRRLYFQPVKSETIYEWDTIRRRQRTVAVANGPISVSPDGRWIASYEHRADLVQTVMIHAIDDGKSREIFRLSGGQLDVIPMPWTATSDAVIVRRFAGPPTRGSRGGELLLVPLDGRAPKKLKVDLGSAVAGQLGKIRLRPDDVQLAYVVGKSYQTETWVLENFLPKGAAAPRIEAK